MLVVLALYLLGGTVIHGFAFSAADRLRRRHLFVDLHRQPDRAVLRARSQAASTRRRAAAPHARGTAELTASAAPDSRARQRRRRSRRARAAARWSRVTSASALDEVTSDAGGCARLRRRARRVAAAGAAARQPPRHRSRARRRFSMRASPSICARRCCSATWRRRPTASSRALARAASASASTATTTSTASAAAPSWCASCAPSAHEPLLYIPHRLRDGYGLNDRGRAAARRSRARG